MAIIQPKSLNDTKKIGLKASFNSLSYVPRFFKEIWQTNKKLFLVSAFCRLIAALLPVVILWIGKIIIDEIIRITSNGEKDFSELWKYVLLEFILVVISDLVSRAIALTDGILGDQYNIKTSVRIIVLQEGTILEAGTHQELMTNNKLYAKLFSLQAEGYQ